MAQISMSPAGPRRVAAEVELWRETGMPVSARAARAIAQYWVSADSDLLPMALGRSFDPASAESDVRQRLSANGETNGSGLELAALAAWLKAESRTAETRKLTVVA